MEGGFITIILLFSFGLLLAAMILTLVRLLKGPGIHDRIAAMDLIAAITIGFIILFSVASDDPIYFDIAMVIALVSFISTVAISTYLKQKYD